MEKSEQRNVVMTMPELPRYSKLDSTQEHTRKTGTKLFTVGLCLVLVALLAFLGAVFLVLPPAVQEGESGKLLQAENIELNFDYGGQRHKENVRLSEGGNILRVIDTEDGFEVILDNDKGLALIKNTTSSVCYFTRLENIPELTGTGSGQFRPLFVIQESQMSSDEGETVQFQLSGQIPADFVETVTGPDMKTQCRDLNSYWLEQSGSARSIVKRYIHADVIIVYPVLDHYWRG